MKHICNKQKNEQQQKLQTEILKIALLKQIIAVSLLDLKASK